MAPLFKRSVARGFTLIELLIVVIILAILAAIAIPQFSASTTDAQLSALDSNLATVRTALEQYKVQHANVYPGTVTAALIPADVACPDGSAPTSPAAGTAALTTQLSGFTNAAGQVCPTSNATTFKYGPYLRQIPVEPFSTVNTVVMSVETTIAGAAAGTGWAYNSTTGQFVKNSSALDGTTADHTYAQR